MRFTTSLIAFLGCATVGFTSAIPKTQGDFTTTDEPSMSPAHDVDTFKTKCTHDGQRKCDSINGEHIVMICLSKRWFIEEICKPDQYCSTALRPYCAKKPHVARDGFAAVSTNDVADNTADIATPSTALTALGSQCTEGEQKCIQAFIPGMEFPVVCQNGKWNFSTTCTMDHSCCPKVNTATDETSFSDRADVNTNSDSLLDVLNDAIKHQPDECVTGETSCEEAFMPHFHFVLSCIDGQYKYTNWCTNNSCCPK